jgi:hypothetical protein
MNRNNKLAVLMPVYNGGKLLLRSVESLGRGGLGPNRYEVFVVDNDSTDGAVAALPRFTADAAPVNVFHNRSNIGRVANWNRAVDIAIQHGYQYVTFLFAGDCWTDPELARLFDLVLSYRACMAFSPFVVADATGCRKRISNRFHVRGTAAVLSAGEMVRGLVESGLFPLGPLQANIYRIGQDERPFFDPSLATRTDVDATLDYLLRTDGQVVIGSTPFLEWREHAGRFHMSMGAARTIEDYMETFRRACALSGPPRQAGQAKAQVVLNSLRLMISDAPVREWPRLIRLIRDCSAHTPCEAHFSHFLETLWSRYALGRRLLQFG